MLLYRGMHFFCHLALINVCMQVVIGFVPITFLLLKWLRASRMANKISIQFF